MTSPNQYAVFHRLTGQLVEIDARLRSLLLKVKEGSQFSFEPQHVTQFGAAGRKVQWLVDNELLIGPGVDPLAGFIDFFAVRPLQNPALTFRRESGELTLTSISMSERIYSPAPNQRPPIIEEEMPEGAARLLQAADGRRTLRQIHADLSQKDLAPETDHEFRAAINFLTEPSRQLIKLAPPGSDLEHPFLPFNTVPRNFYHAARWAGKATDQSESKDNIQEFHRQGIEDASWEFDLLEPTVNHALRFPSEVLGGLDYGARFFRASLAAMTRPADSQKVSVLEIGGGTGSFARSFITEAKRSIELKYHILDLSPALILAQDAHLSQAGISVKHFEQDATHLDLPGRAFDLIVANEVMADFPVTLVDREQAESDTSLELVRKYELSISDAPASFYINSGVFQFLERAWLHLEPGGAVILSEYGGESTYPTESFHLNHPEFSIHFGHVSECARKIGFEWQLQKLSEFLSIDVNVSVLNGREEHLMCLGHVFRKFGAELPFALFSRTDFEASFADTVRRAKIEPIRFLPLKRNFYYGAELDQFWVLLLKKPAR